MSHRAGLAGAAGDCLVDWDSGDVGVCSLLVVFLCVYVSGEGAVLDAWPLWRSVQLCLLRSACHVFPLRNLRNVWLQTAPLH